MNTGLYGIEITNVKSLLKQQFKINKNINKFTDTYIHFTYEKNKFKTFIIKKNKYNEVNLFTYNKIQDIKNFIKGCIMS